MSAHWPAEGAIDLHHHAIPDGLVARVRADGERYGVRIVADNGGAESLVLPDGSRAPLPRHASDIGIRDERVRHAGISAAAVSVRPLVPALTFEDEDAAVWYSRAVNDAIAEDVARSGLTLVGFADLPLRFPDRAAAELDRAVTELGFAGAQIGTHASTPAGTAELGDASLRPFWEAADALGATIFIHPTQPMFSPRLRPHFLANLIGNPLETTTAVASLVFDGVCDRHPDLGIVLAHAGGFFPWIHGRWSRAAGIRPEIDAEALTGGSLEAYLRRFHYDTMIYDDDALRHLVEVAGDDRVVIGTDHPADIADLDIAQRLASATWLDDAQRARITRDNAVALLATSERKRRRTP